MAEAEERQAPIRPQRLHDDTAPHNDIDEPDDPLAAEEAYGRIGYGRLGAWSPYALAALIILTIVVVAVINQRHDATDNPPSAGQVAPTADARGPAPTFSVTRFDGETFDLAAQRGKVVVVNFWASWCEPCKKEMPALQQLADANPDVVVIGIAATSDTKDKASAFAGNAGITYPLAMDRGGSGAVGEIGAAYEIFGYPSTFFIDADGQIVDAVFGALPLDNLQTYIDRAKSA